MSANTNFIHIDCDPGIDDAIALMLLGAHTDKLSIVGVSTVGGNVSIEKVTRNASDICAYIGCCEIPVAEGCAHPMIFGKHTVEEVHGTTGLGSVVLEKNPRDCVPIHGVQLMIQNILNSPVPVRILALGPLTNLAMAFILAPSIRDKIGDIVFMGGAIGQGNVPGGCAEFNIYTDPHAAHVVLQSGVKLTMIGLDVTSMATVTPKRIQEWKNSGKSKLACAAAMLEDCYPIEKERYGFSGALIHDACAAAFLLHPAWFETRLCPVHVETASPLTMGKTVVDWFNWTRQPANVDVAHAVRSSEFIDFLEESLASYDSEH